jgi:hypothetical protein
MIDYWRSLGRASGAPLRSDFDPAAVISLLPQTFMAGRAAGLPLRLAGGLIEDLHGRSLRAESFLKLWAPESRAAVRDAAALCLSGREPAVLYAEARTESDERAGIELTLAALTGPSGEIDRLLGLYQPISPLARLGRESVVDLTHRLTVYAGAQVAAERGAHLKLAAVDGRRIA